MAISAVNLTIIVRLIIASKFDKFNAPSTAK